MAPLLLLSLLLLAGCLGGAGNPAPATGKTGDDSLPGAVRFNPNVRIGEVVWINDQSDFAVVRLDAPRSAFQPAFLLALDPEGTQVAGFLVGGGQVQGRSFGARILEGQIVSGGEVRIPGPEWTEYLYNRYNRSERLPASAR